MPSRQPAQRPVGMWSETEVSAWLATLGEPIAGYSEVFFAGKVDGEVLLSESFGESRLEELGVANAEHRQRILRGAEGLRSRQAAEYRQERVRVVRQCG